MKKSKSASLLHKIKRHWPLVLLMVVGVFYQTDLALQIIYPTNRLLPMQKIDGVGLGGWHKSDAIKRLDSLYLDSSANLYFGQSKTPYLSPKLSQIGLSVSNTTRISKYNYAWYLRIIPTSIFWAQNFADYGATPTYNRDKATLDLYITNNFGADCKIEALNATLEYENNMLVVVPSRNGGTCNIATLRQQLTDIKPKLDNSKLRINMKEVVPEVSDATAEELLKLLNAKVSKGVEVLVDGNSQTVSATDLFSWMDFTTDHNKLIYTLSSLKASGYLASEVAPKVTVAAGTSTVTTYNFNETARVDGSSGRGLDIAATLDSIKSAIDDGKPAQAIVRIILPKVVYIRGYSPTDTGLSALISQYAESHPGISSVAFVELSGSHRRAIYNGDEVLVSASTYKLFVAYSVLSRIEDGSWKWTDQVLDDGRNLSACFSDMIALSDNDCAEAMGKMIGYSTIDSEIQGIGCINSSIAGRDGYAVTTANDLALFLAQLQTGQMLTQQSSRDLLINAMKQNVFRSGIPSGVGWEVADKPGFIDDTLNDAAIVYTSSGPYVLVIMTKGSSWDAISDLTNKIETLRLQ